jgi:UDP-N-acetylmuramate--alanine ligase
MSNASEPKIFPGQHIHLVGIGGSGLSAIARVLLGQGYKVSGSDRKGNAQTEALARDGALIYEGHDAVYVNGADALIVSSAVSPDHVEVAAARERGVPIYKRQDIIADLMRGKLVIAVAGTHGKTTTTSMIVHILREAGLDPGYIVGGIMRNTGTNAAAGSGSYFVIEADEYDNMFHGLQPDIGIITNVEYDHPDFFKSVEEMRASFTVFARNTRFLFVCADDPFLVELYQERHSKNELGSLYGLGDLAIIRAENIRTDADGSTLFDYVDKTFGSKRFPAWLNVPGIHNVKNALVAIRATGRPIAEAIAVLETFQGSGRRFDLRGEVDGVAVIDDYAHHPTAIRATLEAARQRYPERQLWAVWQPHTFSRTQALMYDYVTAFGDADHVLVTDIYAAREQPVEGVNSAAVVAAINHPDARHTSSLEDAVAVLNANVQAPAAIIIMSAGDAPQIGVDFLKLRGETTHETFKPAR